MNTAVLNGATLNGSGRAAPVLPTRLSAAVASLGPIGPALAAVSPGGPIDPGRTAVALATPIDPSRTGTADA